MKRLIATILFTGLATVPALAGGGHGGDRVIVKPNAASRFATLPDGVAFPEGIAVNPRNGDIYVSTFNFGGNNKLLRFNKTGKLLAQKDFGGTPLLGLAFNEADQMVYIANFGASQIQCIDADINDAVGEVADIPQISNESPAPNGLVFDGLGNLYVSDSFQGAIFEVVDPAASCQNGGTSTVGTVIQDGLLATAGFPPFGANGLALSEGGTTLYVANSGDDRILTLDLNTKDLTIFAESINGADGIAFGPSGHLWVAANQGDHVVALDANGLVVAQLGAFLGIRNDGAVRGLLFPASVAIRGHKLFVTNLALPLNTGEVEEMVTQYTISRINLPPLHD